MPLNKEQKEKVIAKLKENLQKQKSVVFVDFGKLDSKFLFGLRDELSKSGCLLQAAKKTLIRKALEAIKQDELAKKVSEIKGQLALVFGFDEEIAPAKICFQAGKENEELEILGGVFDGQFTEKEKVLELAQLPSRKELLAMLIGSINAPVSGFVNVLKGNLKGLLQVLANAKT